MPFLRLCEGTPNWGVSHGAFVLEKIANFMKGGESATVVFGSSHPMKPKPVL
jgi:hypothetical protein